MREMASNAAASIGGMDILHDAYLAGVKANPGKLPVVKLGHTRPIVSNGKAASSTNYEPGWEIVAWVDRPADLSPEAVAAMRTGGDAAKGLNGSGELALVLSAAASGRWRPISDDF